MCLNQLELPAREPTEHLFLWPDDLAQVQHLFFDLQNRIERLLARIRQCPLLHLSHLHCQLVERRLVVLHNRIQQRMRNAVRLPRDVRRIPQAHLRHHLHWPQRLAVKRYKKILAEVKTQLRRREHPVLAAVVHRVDHHEQVRGKCVVLFWQILLDLWRGTFCDTVFDRERVKVEDVFQQELRFLRGGIFEVNPQEQLGVRQQRRHQEQLDVLAVQPALGSKCE